MVFYGFSDWESRGVKFHDFHEDVAWRFGRESFSWAWFGIYLSLGSEGSP